MKAIHNLFDKISLPIIVVYANAKILKWKQFTTEKKMPYLTGELFMLMQRY